MHDERHRDIYVIGLQKPAGPINDGANSGAGQYAHQGRALPSERNDVDRYLALSIDLALLRGEEIVMEYFYLIGVIVVMVLYVYLWGPPLEDGL